MLEILYDKQTKEVRGWCTDEEQFGKFKLKQGEEIVILPISPPSYISDHFFVDLTGKKIYGKPLTLFQPSRNLKLEIDKLITRVENLERKVR